ncbi:hypothetical protein LXL04_001666 [Taraxacum kok-saghyz]
MVGYALKTQIDRSGLVIHLRLRLDIKFHLLFESQIANNEDICKFIGVEILVTCEERDLIYLINGKPQRQPRLHIPEDVPSSIHPEGQFEPIGSPGRNFTTQGVFMQRNYRVDVRTTSVADGAGAAPVVVSNGEGAPVGGAGGLKIVDGDGAADGVTAGEETGTGAAGCEFKPNMDFTSLCESLHC